MSWMKHLKIMPLLVLVAALSFGVRFGEFVTGVSSAPGAAQAQDPALKNLETDNPVTDQQENSSKLSKKPIPKKKQKPSVEAPRVESISEITEEEEGEREKERERERDKVKWKDSIDSDLEFSVVKMELFEDLSARRKALSVRERELAVREALLKAAEQEINQKYTELVSLRSEIQELLVEQTDEEKLRIASLVKIYEGMKPKDAARIFNTLDLDVLLQVVSQMSERKSAPVLASMSPERARTLTMMLAEQKSLPNMSDGFIQ